MQKNFDMLRRYYSLNQERVANLLSDTPTISLVIEDDKKDFDEDEDTRELNSLNGRRIEVRLKKVNGEMQIVSAQVIRVNLVNDYCEREVLNDYDISLLDRKKVINELMYYREKIVPIMIDNMKKIEAYTSKFSQMISIKYNNKEYYIDNDGSIYSSFRCDKSLLGEEISHGEVLYKMETSENLVKRVNNLDFIHDLMEIYNISAAHHLVLNETKFNDCIISILLPELKTKRRINYDLINIRGITETYTTDECLSLYNNPDVNINELAGFVERRLIECYPFVFGTIEQLEERLNQLYATRDAFPSNEEIARINQKYLEEYQNKKKSGRLSKLFHKDDEEEVETFHGFGGFHTKEDVLIAIRNCLEDIEKRRKQDKNFSEINNNQRALAARRLAYFSDVYTNTIAINKPKVMKKI